MTRRPKGTRPEQRSDTALFARIASRLEGIRHDDLDEWLARPPALRVSAQAVRKAGRKADRLAGRDALHQWLRIDLDAVDLFCAAVRLLPGSGPDAFNAVAAVPGVVELLRFEPTREMLAVVIYERRSDQQELRAQLAEGAEITSWEQCDLQTHLPAARTWRHLAVKAATAEDLLA